MKRIIILLAFVMTFAGTARAVTIRLTPDGRESIQAAIDRSKDGDIIVLTAGTYEIQSPLLIEHKRDLTIRGEDSVEIVSSETYDHVFSIFDCEMLSITDIKAGHSETPYCYGDVIYITQCENVEIVRCDLYGCGVIGVEMVKSYDIRIVSCLIHDNSYCGIEVLECSGVRIDNNRLIDNYNQLIIDGEFYERDYSELDGIVLRDNQYIYSDNYQIDDDYYEDDNYWGGDDEGYWEAEDYSDYSFDPDEPYSGRVITAGNSANDDYSDIQAAIDSARNGDTVRISEGSYIIDAPLSIYGKTDILIEGTGAVSVFCSSPVDPVFNIFGCSSVCISNIHARHEQEAYCGASVVNCDYTYFLTLVNCELNGCGQVGITGTLYDQNAWVIRNCEIHHNSVLAMYIFNECRQAGTCSLTIDGCKIHHNADGIVIADYDDSLTILSWPFASGYDFGGMTLKGKDNVLVSNGEGDNR